VKPKLEAIRQAVADYMRSEGCSCCRDEMAHREHTAALAGLLDVPLYPDGSGYNFSQFETERQVRSGK